MQLRWSLVVNGVIFTFFCIAESNSHTGNLKLDGSWKIYSLGFGILEDLFSRVVFFRVTALGPVNVVLWIYSPSWKLTYPTGRKRSAYSA